MRIGIDIMGGDHSPEVTTRGAVLAAKELPSSIELVLIGDKQRTAEALTLEEADHARFELVDSANDITMEDNPTKALSAKPSSSIAQGFQMMKEGGLDAFASTGNTGAMMVGALFSVKAIPGVHRPCLTSILPKENGDFGVLLDVGSTPDCKPEVLYQFAILGRLFAQHVHHMESPKVALLSIGEEEKKGNLATQAAHQLLKENKGINFVGNVEGRDLFNDKADVVVCDGFTGNIVLKAIEGFHEVMERHGMHDPFFDRFNYENYGGTPILGINGTVMVGHGISNDVTIKNMILLTRDVVEAKLSDRIRDAFQ